MAVTHGVSPRPAPTPAPTPRPPTGASARPLRAAQVADNLTGHAFLLGAVVCFAFFSWYPMVHEIIMSFQRTRRGETTWVGWDNYERIWNDPAFGAAWQQHARVHRARAGARLRAAVLRRDPAQRVPARPGLPAGPGVPAGDSAARGRACCCSSTSTTRATPASSTSSSRRSDCRTSGFVQDPSTTMPVAGDRVDLAEHGRRRSDLPRRAAEHPRRPVRGGRDRGRRACCAGSGTSRSRRPG